MQSINFGSLCIGNIGYFNEWLNLSECSIELLLFTKTIFTIELIMGDVARL